MPGPMVDASRALDAAIAASRHGRRDKLVRAVRNQKIRTWACFLISGCVATSALAAFFFAGDHEAAEIIAMMACVAFFLAYFAGKTGERKAVEALREMDRFL